MAWFIRKKWKSTIDFYHFRVERSRALSGILKTCYNDIKNVFLYYVCVCKIQFNITFNSISVMLWRCLLVADIVLPYLNAISQAHWYIIPPVTFYSRQWGDHPYVFYLSFKCRVLSKEASSTIFKVFGMTRPGIEPMTSCTLGQCTTTWPPGVVFPQLLFII